MQELELLHPLTALIYEEITMAMHEPITSACPPETAFRANVEAFEAILGLVHGALDAEALVSRGYFDIALSNLAHKAAHAWASCETATMLFLARADLGTPHVLAAEHLLDVLQDRGLDGVRLMGAQVALLSAAARSARRADSDGLTVARQLSDLSGLLRCVIEESALEANPEFVPEHEEPISAHG